MFSALRVFGRTRLLAIVFSICALGALAKPGDLDPTFGTGGQTVVRMGLSAKYPVGVAVQSDGKFIVAMQNSGFQASNIAVLRFNTDLTLDSTWGDQGGATGIFNETPTALTLASGQAVVAVSNGFSATANANGVQYGIVELERFTTSGALDTTFGSGGITAPIDATSSTTSGAQQFNAVAVGADGKLVAVGFTTITGNVQQVLVARYNTNGTLDTSFATTGFHAYAVSSPTTNAVAYGVVVQADGKIVVSGSDGTNNEFIMRLLADGSALDATFGTSSPGYTESGGPVCRGMIAVGSNFFLACAISGNLAVAAYDSTGTYLPSMFAIADAGGASDAAIGLASGSDGRVYAIGSGGATDQRLAILAVAATGGVDTTFAPGGLYVMPETDVTHGTAIAVSGSTIIALGNHNNPAGELLVSTFSTTGSGRTALTYLDPSSSIGYFHNIIAADGGFYSGTAMGKFTDPYMVISKFTPTGALDTSFGIGGHSSILIPGMTGNVDVRDEAIQPDGKVLVVGDFGGWNLNSLRVGVARLGTDGNGDATFNAASANPGFNYVAQGSGLQFTRAVRLQSDGKAIAMGSLASGGIRQMAAVRFNADGTLDGTYGSGGIAITGFPNNTTARYMDLDALGRAVLVGNANNGSGVRVTRLTTSGAIDTTFGIGGVTLIATPSGYTFPIPVHVIVMPSGNIMTAFTMTDAGGAIWFGATRLRSDGTIDPTYGNNGLALMTEPAWGIGQPGLWDASLTANGRLVLMGTTADTSGANFHSFLVRLNPNGSRDLAFGTNGVVNYTGTDLLQILGVDTYANGAMSLSGEVLVGHEQRGWVGKTVADPTAVYPRPETDFDGNATSDLLWLDTSNGVLQGWLMNGTSATQTAQLPLPANSVVTHIADLDGDGRGDVIIRNADGSVTGWIMNGLTRSSFGTIAAPDLGGGWSIAKVADIDGDGKADIIWQNTDGRVIGSLMNGLTVMSSTQFVPAGSGWSVTQVGDFDGDGKADLFWQHTDGSTQAWLMNGLSVSNIASFTPAGTGWSVVMVGDFNGDGKTDLFWQHTDGSTQAWMMNGLTPTGLASFTPAGTGWSPKLTGDIDGDGKSDIFWEHTNGASQTWLMNGLTVSSLASFVPAGTGWTAQHLYDLDGDGKKDVFWRHTNGGVQAWLMNGLTITQIWSAVGQGTNNLVP